MSYSVLNQTTINQLRRGTNCGSYTGPLHGGQMLLKAGRQAGMVNRPSVDGRRRLDRQTRTRRGRRLLAMSHPGSVDL